MNSIEFLTEMDNMHGFVCAAQQAKRKQFELELILRRLRAQVAQYEAALAKENDTVAHLFPCISVSREKMHKTRQKSTELGGTCQRMGVAISGASYR